MYSLRDPTLFRGGQPGLCFLSHCVQSNVYAIAFNPDKETVLWE